MRIEQITVEVYKFEELDKEVQERVLESMREEGYCWDDIDTQLLSEDFEEHLKEKCYPSDDVNWRLSNSQGDGVAFYGEINVYDLAERYLKEEIITDKEYKRIEFLCEECDFDITIYRNQFATFYSHAHTMSIDCEIDAEDMSGKELLSKTAKKMLDQVQQEVEELSEHFERMGYERMENQYSDEWIKESLEANEIEFTKDGKKWFGF